MSIFSLGELYCGPGGLAYGAMQARSDDGKFSIKHIWANDFDEDSCETYRNNICPKQRNSVICSDVCNLDIESLDNIDAFAYGFPCNSFSSVGEHQGLANKKFGQLYYYGIKVLKKFRPKWFMAENVSGIRSAGSGDFRTILKDMEDAGYRLVVNLYRSEEYGIPQTRHRVIIVGIRDDQKINFKVPSTEPYRNIDISSKTALDSIPKDATENIPRHLSEKVIRRLSYIKPGQNVWQAEDVMPPELKINTRTKISQIYRKLNPSQPSYTITASGGGGTFGYHWTNRELSNRERATLQTFPYNYEFTGNYSSIRKQIGMAVPCKLSQIVVTAILNSFAQINYPSMEPNL